jgi:hypothetical protein
MAFSYLLLGVVITLIAFLCGAGQAAWELGIGTALPVYFFEVTVRGIASLIKHRRVTYQLVDLGAFLFVMTLYFVSTSYSERAEVPMMLIAPTLYFFIVFHASKHVPMAPPREWGNWFPALPLLWQRHLRRKPQDSSVAS